MTAPLSQHDEARHRPGFRQGGLDALTVSFLARPAFAFAVVVAMLLALRWLLVPLADMLAQETGELSGIASQLIKTSLNVAAIAAAALPFQLLAPAVQRRPKIATREYWLDVIYWHQGVLLQVLSVPAALLFVDRWMWSWASGPWFPALVSLPIWLQVLLAVWLYDLVVYWRHRTEHVFGALWSFHAVHHSAEQVDILTTLRLHPLELVYATLTGAAVLLVGLQAEATAIGYAAYTVWNYFIHTNVKVRFSGFMKYVLVSPFMHQWHHALDREAAGKNIGVVFAWNDWLFGSAYHPAHWPSRFGIDVPEAERMSQSYWWQLAYPFLYAWAARRKAGHRTVPRRVEAAAAQPGRKPAGPASARA